MSKFMNQSKPISTKRYLNRSVTPIFIGLSMFTFLLFSATSCRNKDKTTATTTQVTTETVPLATVATAANTKSPDQLQSAQAPQSPLHKLLDSLNKAGQPQWKLSYLDSVAAKNKNITMPQLKRIFDSLGQVKRGFIKK
jgi:hypothetical protein